MKLKKGCLLIFVITPGIFFIISSIILGFYWFFEIYIPQREIENAVKITDDASTSVISKGDDGFPDFIARHGYWERETSGNQCKVVFLPELSLRFCPDNSERHLVFVEITDRTFDRTTDLALDTGEYATAEGDVGIAYSRDRIFAVWRNEKQDVYSVYLKAYDRLDGKEGVIIKLYEKGFGINNISAGYSVENNELLIAWNDWSYSSNKDLFLGRADVERIIDGDADFSVRQVLKQDKWDKNGPYFIIDGPELYLAHSTGHHMGFFVHEGTVSIGVSKIGAFSSPEEYRIIASEDVLPKILKIENGIVYYTRGELGINGVREVKKIPFSNAYQPFDP